MNYIASMRLSWVLFWINIAAAAYAIIEGFPERAITSVVVAIFMLSSIWIREHFEKELRKGLKDKEKK